MHFDPSLLHRRDDEIEMACIAACIAAHAYKSTVRYAMQDDGGDGWRRAARTDATRRWSR
jgi:hypothetical protein